MNRLFLLLFGLLLTQECVAQTLTLDSLFWLCGQPVSSARTFLRRSGWQEKKIASEDSIHYGIISWVFLLALAENDSITCLQLVTSGTDVAFVAYDVYEEIGLALESEAKQKKYRPSKIAISSIACGGGSSIYGETHFYSKRKRAFSVSSTSQDNSVYFVLKPKEYPLHNRELTQKKLWPADIIGFIR